MGRMGAEGMNEAVQEGLVDLRGALSWHLRANHYPPLPETYIEVCEKVLEAVANAGPYPDGYLFPEVLEEEIWLPDDLDPRPRQARNLGGRWCATVGTLIDILHLDSFINFGDDEEG